MNRKLNFTMKPAALQHKQPIDIDRVHKQFVDMKVTQQTVSFLDETVLRIHNEARFEGRNIPNDREYKALKRLHNVGQWLATFPHLSVPTSCFLTKAEYDAVEI